MDNDRHIVVGTAERGDPIALARRLVLLPSVNPALDPRGSGENSVATACGTMLRWWGFDVGFRDVGPDRPNVVATLKGSGRRTLLLNGHLDTVGVEGMTVPPFAAQLLGSRLVGRGAADMKGGLAALLSAAFRLAHSGPRPNLLIVLTVDEEHASLGMERFVRFESAGPRADVAVVCEPTGLAVMPAHKGFVWVTASFTGRAAHGSLPEEGVDAIRHAALFLSALDRYADALRARPAHPLLGYASVHAGTIRGGSALSVYPDRCEVQLECRTMPGTSSDTVLAELRAVLESVRATEPMMRATLEVTLARPGSEVSPDSALVRGLLDACHERGLQSEVRGMSAWVEASFLNELGIPAVCFGPGSMAQAHTADEWIETSEIVLCADVLETFARRLAEE